MENSGNEHDVVQNPVLNRIAIATEANRKLPCAKIGDERSAFGTVFERQNSLPDGTCRPYGRFGISFEQECFEPIEIVLGQRQQANATPQVPAARAATRS